MAHIKKLNPKAENNGIDFKKDEPKTQPLSVDAEALKFIKDPERNQELSLEGLVDALFESGLHEKRDEIEKTVLRLISEDYVSQHGDNAFEVTKKGETYLHDGKKVAKKSKKVAHIGDEGLKKPRNKTRIAPTMTK